MQLSELKGTDDLGSLSPLPNINLLTGAHFLGTDRSKGSVFSSSVVGMRNSLSKATDGAVSPCVAGEAMDMVASAHISAWFLQHTWASWKYMDTRQWGMSLPSRLSDLTDLISMASEYEHPAKSRKVVKSRGSPSLMCAGARSRWVAGQPKPNQNQTTYPTQHALL